MKKLLVSAVGAALLAGPVLAEKSGNVQTQLATLSSGIDLSSIDKSVRPQDDLYAYANGVWLKNTEIPADKTRIGSFTRLRDEVDQDVRAIIEEAAAAQHSEKGTATQIVGDLYSSFMNEAQINQLGLKPVEASLRQIDEIKDRKALVAYFAEQIRLGNGAPIDIGIFEDFDDPTQYFSFLFQAGLGLPDRDYYFDESEKGQLYITQYKSYLEAMFTRIGHTSPKAAANASFVLEKRLAGSQRDPVENRQFDKWNNKHSQKALHDVMPGFEWDEFLKGIGFEGQKEIALAQPEYFAALDAIITETSLAEWRDYLKVHLLGDTAPFLSQDVYDIYFGFYRTALRGQESPRPRWQRGVALVNQSVGELVGQVYVKEHFPPAAKQRMLELVANLVDAYRESIIDIDWMSEDTKKMALDKLSKFLPKIAYPDQWKEYQGVTADALTLLENVDSAASWNYSFELAKLGKKADRAEWGMNPQTVNAYYHPMQNTVNFPAGILRPPFFNQNADDAVNYGAIGMVIGHELGHGFDDQGSKFNGDGVLKNWWTDSDRKAFEQRTSRLVAQYNHYEVLPGLFLNGELTQGENIGDLSGMSIAFRAYKNSLKGREAPVLDGFTGDERFFLGSAQVFSSKARDDSAREQVKTDPHSISRFRVNGTVVNVPAFYETFGVKTGDQLFLKQDERVSIW